MRNQHRNFRTSIQQKLARLLCALSALSTLLFLAPQVFAQDATVEVLSYTDGATLYVDDIPMATIPMFEPLFLPPGTFVFRLDRPGYVYWEEEITLGEGEDLLLEIDLLPFGGIVRVISSEPGARLLVDGEELGALPFEGEISLGTHRFTVQKDYFEEWTTSAVIAAGEEYLFEANLIALPDLGTVTVITETTPFFRQWWFWTSAAVVIGGGVATTLILSEDEQAAPVDILISLP
jgi:hypothetical protein